MARKLQPKLIILDVLLPELDGWTVRAAEDGLKRCSGTVKHRR